MNKPDLKNTSLGIELGSTRIKAALIDKEFKAIASGTAVWENKFEAGLWTYSESDIVSGLRECFASLKADFYSKYGIKLTSVGKIGISAMMHGYLVFDKNDRLLVPFRTWRNNNAEDAASELTEIFSYHIPARWSIAHLYAAVKGGEPHVKDIAFQTTLAGYVHYLLTGEKVVGIGEASGMFPVDGGGKCYRKDLAEKFENLPEVEKYGISVDKIFPKILVAGENAGTLTKSGARLLDPDGDLMPGAEFCPPEGDAGTGMVATNSVKVNTGNVSAGTSIFAMIVMPREMTGVYPEIDVVTTPSGDPVAMVHCNNCSSALNGWVDLFGEFSARSGGTTDRNELYKILFEAAERGKPDCGGVTSCNYLSGENITGVEYGHPATVYNAESEFSLWNFMRSQLYSALATLKIGTDILFKTEKLGAEKLYAHGGLFKTKGVFAKYLAAALGVPVALSEEAGEGGAYGMALLAAYLGRKEKLDVFLADTVFGSRKETLVIPDPETEIGFEKYMNGYMRLIAAEKLLSEGVDHA